LSSNEEIEGLADILECVAVTLYEILRCALFNVKIDGYPRGEDQLRLSDTGNLREGARNIAYKVEAWDKLP